MADFGASIFVLGATGYTGREVVCAARDAGLVAIAHVRPDSPRLDEWTRRFKAKGARVDSAPWNVHALTAAFRRENPAAIVIAIGTTRDRAKRVARAGGEANTQSYASVDYGLTKMAAAAAVASGHRPRLVYLSAIGTSARSTSPYGRARWMAEEAVRGSGLPFTIVRPAFVSGADRDDSRPAERAAATFFDALSDAAGAVGFDRFGRRWRTITGAQLGRALVRVALDGAFEDRIVESEDLIEKLSLTR
ncbi:MAG: NAD(P)H-binding protein [Deltaproteobacteria bacterium]|nr:NAD(P)H-binding protein [Deltaproteobacteria bacterium]